MTALAMASESINSLVDIAKERLRWRSTAWMIGLSLIVVASIISSLSYTAKADGEVDRRFEAKLALFGEQAQRISQLQRLKSQAAIFAAQAALDASMIDAAPRSRALAEVDNALMPGIRLMGIALDVQMQSSQGDAPSTSTSAPADGAANLLRIKGIASDESAVSGFVARLGKSPWFHGLQVLPVAASWASGAETRTFEVQAVFGESAAAVRSGKLAMAQTGTGSK